MRVEPYHIVFHSTLEGISMKDITGFFSWVFVTLVTLLPIINPVSTAVLLLGISAHLSKEERNRQITRACIYMTAILVAFLLAGHLIMVAFGISIPGIRIAGGMVIGFLGVDSLSRIMGFLLICIGTQFVINGVRDLILDTAFWRSLS